MLLWLSLYLPVAVLIGERWERIKPVRILRGEFQGGHTPVSTHTFRFSCLVHTSKGSRVLGSFEFPSNCPTEGGGESDLRPLDVPPLDGKERRDVLEPASAVQGHTGTDKTLHCVNRFRVLDFYFSCGGAVFPRGF